MPLTAEHPTAGTLDATLPDLGAAVSWGDVHKPVVPVALTCRGCGGSVHAKVSVRGQRFFAHHRRSDDCPLNGETPEHRLLKSELAAGIRAAGWVADLEVAGGGWRADVLAASPDGTQRVAFEAQLASATVDELADRTATMRAELDAVCWVTDKDVPWLARVPSARVRRDDAGTLLVADGVARFAADWCDDRRRCDAPAQHGFYERDPGPCPGHGYWVTPDGVTLEQLVGFVCSGRVVVHETRAHRNDWHTRHPGGRVVWAPPAYVTAEAEQLAGVAAHAAWESGRRSEQATWEANIAALLARQDALVKPTVEHVFHAAGCYPRVPNGPREPKWAMGVPVFVAGRPYAVICPVASRVTPTLRRTFAGMTVVVASDAERTRLAKVCAPGQAFAVIPVTVPTPPPTPAGGMSLQQVVRRMVGFG